MHKGDRYVATGAMSLAIPTSLQASLLARLDNLAPTRAVAQIAAALGRQFSHELISMVATIPKQPLHGANLTSAKLDERWRGRIGYDSVRVNLPFADLSDADLTDAGRAP